MTESEKNSELSELELDKLIAALSGETPTKDPKDDQIAALESQVQDAANKLNEERFLWVLVAIILIDVYVFTQMVSWSGPLVIGVLQLIGIIILADRCQVDTVAPFIDKITGAFRRATIPPEDGGK